MLDDEEEDSFLRSPPAEYHQPDSTTSSMGATNSNAPDFSPRPLLRPQPQQQCLSPTQSPRNIGSVKSSRGAGIVGKPLIFGAMASVDQPSPQPQQQTSHLHTRVQQPERTQPPPLDKRVSLMGMNSGHQVKTVQLNMNRDGNMRALPPQPLQHAYPSPPAEFNDSGGLPVRREFVCAGEWGVEWEWVHPEFQCAGSSFYGRDWAYAYARDARG